MPDERLAKYTALVDPATDGPPGLLFAADRGLREPERQLLFAVLLDAIKVHDRAWISGVGGVWPFTFENVCETFGMDPGSLQRKLLVVFARGGRIARPPRRAVALGMSAQARAAHNRRREPVI